MGIFDRLFSRSKSERRSLGRFAVEGGRVVYYSASPDFAKKVGAVYRCEKLISESIAKIPLEVKRYNSIGKYYMRDVKNPLYDVLNIRPNARMTSYDLLRATIIKMLDSGNAYLYPERENGNVVALYLLENVAHDKMSNTYMVSDSINNIHGTFTGDEIIHLRNIGRDGYTGESTISKAARVIGISSSADEELSSLFATGSRYRGIITGNPQGAIGVGGAAKDQLKAVRDNMREELQQGETLVWLPGEMKFMPFSMTPADVQLLDNKKFTVQEVGRFFSVPPHMLYTDGGNAYSNAENESVEFMNDTLSPLLTQIEKELNAKLIDPMMRGYYKIQFDREALYTTDLTTKANYMKATIEAGVRTVNEWRRADGFPMLEGGDEAVVSANLVTLKSRINEGQQEGNTQS